MQIRNRSKKYFIRDKSIPWYKSEFNSGLSFTFAFLLWLISSAYIFGQLNAPLTKVILKKDGCIYMHHLQISTASYDVEAGMCVITAPFRSDLIDDGGEFKLEDRKLHVADNQIVAIEKLNTPYSESQKRMTVWLSINTALFFATMVWAIFCLFKSED